MTKETKMSEAMVTAAEPDHVHHDVIVNGEEKEVNHRELTFHQVCLFAFPDGPFGDNIVYTVTYSYKHGGDHILNKGQQVEIKNGMVFNVGNTDRS
jgi:hypothetical protein